ncbi:hypothetical protein Plhal703r1_c34g0127661 [Plasmopara halstedii]
MGAAEHRNIFQFRTCITDHITSCGHSTMHKFPILISLATTLVVNGTMVSSTAVNDTQGSAFSLRTKSLKDAQQEERATGIDSSVESTGPAAKISKEVEDQIQKALLEPDLQDEIVKLNSFSIADMRRFLNTLHNHDLSWGHVRDSKELRLTECSKNAMSKYNKGVFPKSKTSKDAKGDSKVAKAIANAFGKKEKPFLLKILSRI